ncbi:hypothetical protein RJ641_017356 [Dillenia turbinata]|uniref:Uncharacterized protein n=1 Tax=Dillenia turbinata TaxID=194707 RepID=A0AAN8UTM1_9MAGN
MFSSLSTLKTRFPESNNVPTVLLWAKLKVDTFDDQTAFPSPSKTTKFPSLPTVKLFSGFWARVKNPRAKVPPAETIV